VVSLKDTVEEDVIGGTSHVTEVEETKVVEGEGVPSKRQLKKDVFSKFVPVTVTIVPPAMLSEGGVIIVIVGVGLYSKSAEDGKKSSPLLLTETSTVPSVDEKGAIQAIEVDEM
jgi:hypothetical protein